MAPEGTFSPEVMRGRLLDTCRVMAELHNVDPDAVGLGDEPVVGLEAEVQRWKNAFDACDEDLKANTDDIYDQLMATIPSRSRAGCCMGTSARATPSPSTTTSRPSSTGRSGPAPTPVSTWPGF